MESINDILKVVHLFFKIVIKPQVIYPAIIVSIGWIIYGCHFIRKEKKKLKTAK